MSDRESPSDPGPPVWAVDAPATRDDEAAELAELGVITVGDLLATTARAVGARLPQFLTIAIVVMLPAIALSVLGDEWVYAAQRRMSDDPYADLATTELAGALLRFGGTMLQSVLQFLAQAAMMYGTIEFMAGRRASVLESLRGGFSNAVTVLALAVLNTLAIGAATLCCIVPGLIVTCVLFASVPAAVTERLGPIDAMQRSAELTTGHRMTIFLALFAIVAVWLVFACTAGMGLMIASGPDIAPAYEPLATRVMGYATEWVLTLFMAICQAALAAVFYARVRGIRDGVDADAIAKVFE